MKFYKNLYVGDTVKKPNRIKRKLKCGAKLPGIFVVTMASGADQLEIYNSLLLQQTYYKEQNPCIIGIAGSYEEAVSIVCLITEETITQNQNADLKKYLRERIRKA